MAAAFGLCLSLGASAQLFAQAAPPDKAVPATPVVNSPLDAPMFYQLLVGEMEAQAGREGNAFEVMLDAARRSKDEALFQRSVDLAIQLHSGDKALIAVKAWRTATPESNTALRTQVQLLVALDRPAELADPLRELLNSTPVVERNAMIASLPRLLQSTADKPRTFALMETALAPDLQSPATRTVARTTLGYFALAAGDRARALELARRGQADDPTASGPALLALEMMADTPEAEALVTPYLARPDAAIQVRLAYVRVLDSVQRLADARDQLRIVVAQRPELTQAWLSLGAHLVDLRESAEAERALLEYTKRYQAQPQAPAQDPSQDKAAANAAPTGAGDDDAAAMPEHPLDQAWLLLSQAAEQQGDMRAAQQWLARIDSADTDLQILGQRAKLMARQGQLKAARELIRNAPARDAAESQARMLAEVQLLREMKLWQDAWDMLAEANRQTPDDVTLLYEQAMIAERLNRMEDMEKLLRQVVALKPDYQHALNALGYSLADRNIRLDEALTLVRKAAALAPGDPFITDSLGWVEYRRGNRDEALKLLRQAHAARPDTEISAHLGEVLWVYGQRDEALRVWRDGRARDASNEVLQETLARLKVSL